MPTPIPDTQLASAASSAAFLPPRTEAGHMIASAYRFASRYSIVHFSEGTVHFDRGYCDEDP
jgi:hypothetical protein